MAPSRPSSPRIAHARETRSANGERLAAIDIGSNSIHMLVVASEPSGGYRVLDREKEMVRLGKSALGESRRLSEKAMRRGLVALAKMSTLARLKGAERVVVVATSAVREAENRDEFLARVRARTGFEVRLLDGEEEARLIYRAVREAVNLGRGAAVIADVGGGSTEWIVTRRGEAQRLASVRLGSLRLASRLEGDPPGRSSLIRLRREVRAAIAALPVPAKLERMVATSGTAVCCADLVQFLRGEDWKSGGALREIRRRDLEALVDHLRRLEREQIAALPPVGGPRSESILAGAVLLEELVRHAGARSLLVSDRALREGLVLETLGKPVDRARQPEDVRRDQVLALAQRGSTVVAHGQETARLATRLFDLTQSLHGLGSTEREWLEYGALLHDLGYVVDYEKHHKHGFYLVNNAALDAFDRREIEIIAHLVRYHRGALPGPRHDSFRELKPWQQRTIERLTPLLRIADALDRSHARRVREIYCSIRRKSVRLELISPWNLTLEIDTAHARARSFEEAFGRRLRVRRGLEKAKRKKRRARTGKGDDKSSPKPAGRRREPKRAAEPPASVGGV